MKRGDIVAFTGRGDFSTKPRLGLVVQSDLFNEHHPAITICPITGERTGDALYRVAMSRDEANGLLKDSEIEVDLVQSVRRERIGRRIGRASQDTMTTVDMVLRRWLAL